MKCINATKFHRKSGGAKWRDLLFTIPRCRPQMEAPPSPLSSRPERSEVEGSAVRPSDSPNLPYQTSTPNRSVIRPERTWISCHAALDKSTCAPFRKEGRMKCINATKFHRKCGGA
jgi:hypothetical protein